MKTIATLEAERAAIPEDGALPATISRDELAAILIRRVTLDRRIMAARDAEATLASLPSAEPDELWLAFLNTARAKLCDERLALPPRIRDPHMLGVQKNISHSLRCIDFGLAEFKDSGWDLMTLRLGALMREAGYEPTAQEPARNYAGEMPWFGTVDDVEHRLKNTERRRAAALAQLDDALMDDAERERREAESKQRIAALNALPVRKTRGDGSQYDKYPDGRRVEVVTN